MSNNRQNPGTNGALPSAQAAQDMVRRELDEIAPGLAGFIEGNIIAAPPEINGQSCLNDPSILAYVVHGQSGNELSENVAGPTEPIGINIYIVNETESGTPVFVDITTGHSAIIDAGTKNVIVPLHQPHSSDSVIVNIHQTTPSSRAASMSSSSESQYRCPICFRDAKELESLRATLCGHICCGCCLKTALEICPICPICKAPANFSESILLFF
ncbi:GL24318 [Drosophila persimilis]|uniref:GL24318 n=1 Tax=Drosophila persimilis TaxID=7234 RepID=B4G588_DROPE|nr:uncharacterized protein LOC6588269 [Drosophila persimilis]EDW24754.1 GL24318 [Drosophila persimilis]